MTNEVNAVSDGMNEMYYNMMLKTLNTVYQDVELSVKVNQVLGMIGEFINVSRSYVFEDRVTEGVSVNTYEWCAEGIIPQIDELSAVPLEEITAWHDMLKTEGIVRADNIKTLPQPIIDILEPQGVYSIVALPLVVNNGMLGYIGFDECKGYREWTEKEIEMLRVLSSAVATLISRSNSEAALAASLERFHAVLDSIENPIYVADPKTDTILFANRKFMDVVGRDAVEGEVCWKLLNAKEDTRCEKCPHAKLDQMKKGVVYNSEEYNETVGGWFYRSDSLIDWIDGRTVHLASSMDITTRMKYEEKLKFSATYDMMTGILNRESGLSLLREALQDLNDETSSLTFCYMDVDGLKYANDNYGHVEGDRLITMIVSTIRHVVRKTDIFARLGGDEFMLVFRNCKQADAEAKIAAIRRGLNEMNDSGRYPYRIAISVGMLEVEPGMEYNVDTILMIADKRMYRDKQSKRVV